MDLKTAEGECGCGDGFNRRTALQGVSYLKWFYSDLARVAACVTLLVATTANISPAVAESPGDYWYGVQYLASSGRNAGGSF